VTLKRRALFLDWGGTLVVTRNNRTLVDADGNALLARHVVETLARVRPHFDLAFIVSNQARIGRGEISEAEVVRRFAEVNERLGKPFDGWRLCPHQDVDACACRKPNPGMFVDLAAEHDIDLEVSLHVGDSQKDREAARAVGLRFAWAHEFFRAPGLRPPAGETSAA
jgi:D-glycero-D-manno-heptose 1,7-bisphosphate phosphatase